MNNYNKQELKELKKRYKLFYDYAPLPYQSLDEDTKIIDVNQAWLDFFGYEKEEVVGKCFGEYLVNKSREMLTSRFSYFKEVGLIQDIEYEIVKKNGIHSIIWLDGRIEYDRKGNFKQAHCFFKDITKRKRTEEDLKESEGTYRLIFESIADPLHVVDADLKIIYLNPAFERWLKSLNLDLNIVGKTSVEAWPFVGDNVNDEYQKVLKTKKIHIKEDWTQINDISTYTETRKIPIIKSGDVVQIITIIRDFSDRKKAEQKLKESEEKFRNITEQSFMSIYIIQDGLLKYRNQRATEVSGYNREDIKKFKPYEYAKLIHPEDREFVLEQSRKKQEGETDVTNRYKYRIIKKSGEVAWIDSYSKTINYRGKPADLVMIEDITEKIVAEQKLKESEEKYKYLFSNALVGLYWSRISDGKFLECNDVFANLFGYATREEALEDYVAIEHYVYPNQRNEILDAIHRNKEVRGYEILVTKKDGTPIWLSVSARISENHKRIEGAAIDITKRKKAEQELLDSEERYKKAYDKADFYKDLLAHDVGNILNNISASVQLIEILKKNYEIPERERDLTEIIRQQLERGASLISNVRKLSEVKEGEASVKTFDANSLLENCIENVRSRFHEKGLEISFNSFQEIANVAGGALLIDAFENVLINGVIHNNSEKIKLWINLSKVHQEGNDFVKIEFEDNGLGISEDRKESIFKRNYEKDRSTGGMGIGLSLVKNIITSYGGQAWVENRVKGDYSQGSNFIVLLKEG